MSTNAQNWRDLTNIQRYGWGVLGTQVTRQDSLGQTYTLSGFMTFCLINNNRLAAGDVVVLDPPLHAPPDPLATITPTATVATLSVAYTPTPLSAGERAFISASPQRSAGRNFEGDYRLIAVTAAAAASPANIFTAYQARFGTPVVGSRIFVCAQRYLNGWLSTPILSSIVVA